MFPGSNICESNILQKMLLSCYVQLFCDPLDCSPPGSSLHGISQARILKWVVISVSRGSSRPRNWTRISCLAGRFFNTEPPGKPPEKKQGLEKHKGIYATQPLPQEASRRAHWISYLKGLWGSGKHQLINSGTLNTPPLREQCNKDPHQASHCSYL